MAPPGAEPVGALWVDYRQEAILPGNLPSREEPPENMLGLAAIRDQPHPADWCRTAEAQNQIRSDSRGK
jgi:hypothetical protein